MYEISQIFRLIPFFDEDIFERSCAHSLLLRVWIERVILPSTCGRQQGALFFSRCWDCISLLDMLETLQVGYVNYKVISQLAR